MRLGYAVVIFARSDARIPAYRRGRRLTRRRSHRAERRRAVICNQTVACGTRELPELLVLEPRTIHVGALLEELREEQASAEHVPRELVCLGVTNALPEHAIGIGIASEPVEEGEEHPIVAG